MKRVKREDKKIRPVDLDEVSVWCYFQLFLLRALGDRFHKIWI
jgi:hypothetical protein